MSEQHTAKEEERLCEYNLITPHHVASSLHILHLVLHVMYINISESPILA